ncbi:MAG: hypothetical protein J1E79_06350 [Rikenella sp.]|nr:hypothetical protein [Rikenella sp.]
MKFRLILCSAGLLCACGTHRPNEVPTDRVAVSEVRKNFNLLHPVQMAADGNLLWISDGGAKTMVWVLDLTTGDTVASFLRVGNGPGESRPVIDIKLEGDRIELFSRSMVPDLFQGNTDSILKSNGKTLKPIHRFSPGTDRLLRLSDTTFLTSGSFEEGRFRWINTLHPDSVIYTGTFADHWSEERSIPTAAKNRFHSARLFRHSGNNLIAVSTPYVLSLFKPSVPQGVEWVKDTLLAEYQYDYQNEGMIRRSKKREHIVNGSSTATANDHHIYLLFDTRTGPTSNDDTYYPLIQVYDWNLNHVRNIDPGCKLSTLTVDANDRYLYALTDLGNDNGPQIVRVAL